MSWMLIALLVLTGEQTLVRYTALPGAGEPALAASQGQTLLAWSEVDGNGISRISIASLDARGRIVGDKVALPRTREDGSRHATAPVVASDGRDFLVAWLESVSFNFEPRVVVMRVDASLRPDIATMQELTPLSNGELRGVKLVWNSDHYELVAHETRYQFDANGTALARHPWFKADAIAVAQTRAVMTVSFENVWKSTGRNHCGFICLPLSANYYVVSTHADINGVTRSGLFEREWDSVNPPALAATTDDYLFAWNGSNKFALKTTIETRRLDVSGVPVGDAGAGGRILESYPLWIRATPMQLAADGKRYLAVWMWDDPFTGRHGVEGAVDEDVMITRFAIPTSVRPSSTPRIASTGDGRFLAVYADAGVLYSQGITIGPARRRAVH